MDEGKYCERCKYGPMHFSQARRIEVDFPPPTRGRKILTVCERCLGREEAAKVCEAQAEEHVQRYGHIHALAADARITAMLLRDVAEKIRHP